MAADVRGEIEAAGPEKRPMSPSELDAAARQLKFRDPGAAPGARRDARAADRREIGRSPVSVMHVCGSHEQAIAQVRACGPASRRT